MIEKIKDAKRIMMNQRKILGANIRKYREFKGLSKLQLAKEIGLKDDKQIERLETGHKLADNFGLNRLLNICNILDVTLEELTIKDSNLLSLRFVISEHNIQTLKQFVEIIKELCNKK